MTLLGVTHKACTHWQSGNGRWWVALSTVLPYHRLGTCESAVCVRIESSNRIFSTPTSIKY